MTDLQDMLDPDDAYTTSSPYAASLPQQHSRPGSPYFAANPQQQQRQQQLQQQQQDVDVNGLAYATGGGARQQGVQRQIHGGQYAAVGGLHQQAMPDRLGITPMQLAMLQQQRLQQGRSNHLGVAPSIHSVTSSHRSWSEEQ